LRYGLGAMQGWRIEMEDSHSAIIGLPKAGLEGWSFFAVFDGHAGGTVSKCSSKELLSSILNADNDLFNELASIYGNQNNNNHTSNNNTNSSSQQPTAAAAANTSSSNISLNNCSPSKNADSTTTTPNNHESTTTTTSESPNKPENSDSNSNNKTSEESSINNTNSTKPSSKFTPSHEERLKRAVRQGFLDLDQKLRDMLESDKGDDKSGSTAVACLITPSHVYLINCGDSRAILVSGNKVVLGTYDHKPINPNERERIQNAGGSVMIQRVNGSLAVSRALGDYEYKCVEGRGPCEQLVSPEPEIYAHERNAERDEFVVLACDGIWDVMSNEELKEFVHSRLRITNDLVKISNEILDMCLNKVNTLFFFFF
jgi:serine/threonine protein phosphatase PrpC